MKYVMTKNLEPIIFPDNIQHSTFEFLHPISAGFVSIFNNEIIVYGQSISLNLKFDINDKFIIEKYMKNI